jgi:hypothetical protein
MWHHIELYLRGAFIAVSSLDDHRRAQDKDVLLTLPWLDTGWTCWVIAIRGCRQRNSGP